jgi:arylsulfatase
MSERDHRLARAAYWAMCDLVDDQVGRLLEKLEETGQAENTMVIFTSDHGEMLGDHGIYWKGPYFYEPAVRVPLIVRWPGVIPAGRRSGALIELSDLAPTILEAAGAERPVGMQAQPFWRLLTGESELHEHREDLYSEYYNAMPWHREPTAQVTMVRTRRHKLVAAHGTGTGELYDLEDDPNETRNLWNDPESVDLKLAMYERLADRMAFTVDPLPVRQADW